MIYLSCIFVDFLISSIYSNTISLLHQVYLGIFFPHHLLLLFLSSSSNFIIMLDQLWL